jgi:hypothetical protein
MCFEDYVNSGIWENISMEDVEELTVTEMCLGLLKLR